MLRISIRNDRQALASLTIVRIKSTLTKELADYQVMMVVERGNDVVSVSRRILTDFPRNALNSVALLKAALELFDADALGLEDDIDDSEDIPPDMARRQRPTLRAIQGGKGSVHNH